MVTSKGRFTIPNGSPKRLRGRSVVIYSNDFIRVNPPVVEPTPEEVSYMVRFVSECWEKIDEPARASTASQDDRGRDP